MNRKGPNIGLRQARRLCQMKPEVRLAFLSRGLPVILASAQSLWRGSRNLEKEMPREAEVLRILAEEEAARALVLMDAVRCPDHLVAARMGDIVRWSYDHLARLIYAEATSWKPATVGELRTYVDRERKSHYLEGYAGEYIVPNWCLYRREGLLYADIEAGEEDELSWSDPAQSVLVASADGTKRLPPRSLVHAEALASLGVFTPAGLRATSEIFGQVEFIDQVERMYARELGKRLFTRLVKEKLPAEEATDKQASVLVYEWQMPMYNLEFSMLPVSMDEFEAERENELAALVS